MIKVSINNIKYDCITVLSVYDNILNLEKNYLIIKSNENYNGIPIVYVTSIYHKIASNINDEVEWNNVKMAMSQLSKDDATPVKKELFKLDTNYNTEDSNWYKQICVNDEKILKLEASRELALKENEIFENQILDEVNNNQAPAGSDQEVIAPFNNGEVNSTEGSTENKAKDINIDVLLSKLGSAQTIINEIYNELEKYKN